MPAVIVNDLIAQSLYELNVVPAGQAPAQTQVDFCLTRLNQIFDDWNSERLYVYSDDFPQFTLVPSLAPHTIGPTGTFVVDERPVSIEGITIILGGANAGRVTVKKRDKQWFQNQQVPLIEDSVASGFYYNATEPDGEINFYPVPSTAYDVQLWIRSLLSSVEQFDSIDLPQGYRSALMMTLAEQVAGPMRKPWTQDQARQASNARARIQTNNAWTPRIATRDSGMPRSTVQRRSTWNWKTGNSVTP